MYHQTFSAAKILYSIDPWSRPVLSFLKCFVQLIFGDCEFLHNRNFLSYFLCDCVHPFSLQDVGVVFPDSCQELFKFFQFMYRFLQLLCSYSLSIEHSLVFLKHFLLRILASLILMRFIFMLRYLNLSSAFFLQALPSYSVLGLLIFSVFEESLFPFLVAFLL